MQHCGAWLPTQRWSLTALLLLWVAACYAPALPGPYQFDDYATVAVDPGVASLGAWWQGLVTHVRPLLKGSFALTHTLGDRLGDVPLGHRLGNLAIHGATLLVLLRLGLQLARTCLRLHDARDAWVAAALAAALFATHPLATEAVSYISGRSMALGTLLGCSSLAAWIHARTHRSARWAATSVLLFAAAALVRETVAFSIPLLVIAWELLRHDPSGATERPLLRAARAALPFVALAAATLLWMLWHDRYAWLLQLSAWIANVRAGDSSLLTALGYFASAALLLRYPSIDPDVHAAALSLAQRVFASAGIGAALWWAWRQRLQRPQWLLGMLWVFGWLLPLYAWPVRHDPVAERHFYPALWGAALLASCSAVPIVRGTGAAAWIGRAACIAALLALSALTMVRNVDYRSEVGLWESARRGAPGKTRVLHNLGLTYMEVGRWSEASSVLEQALAENPDHPTLQWALAAAQARDLRVLSQPALLRWPSGSFGAPDQCSLVQPCQTK